MEWRRGHAGDLGTMSWNCLLELPVEKLNDHSCLSEFRG